MLDLDKFTRVHTSLFGEPPKREQLTLYGAFPKAHGFIATEEHDARRFEAVTVMGLAMTYPFDGGMHRTWFLVPAPVEDWAVNELQGIGKRIFGRIRADANLKAANFMRRAFEHLLLGSRAFEFEGPPDHWVAYGFKISDAIPDWLQNGLLAV